MREVGLSGPRARDFDGFIQSLQDSRHTEEAYLLNLGLLAEYPDSDLFKFSPTSPCRLSPCSRPATCPR